MSTQILFIFVNFEPDRRRFRWRKEETMRIFLICEEKINFNTGKPESFKIKGVYNGSTFPSTIQNDPNYSLEKYGVKYPRIIEVAEHCDIEII